MLKVVKDNYFFKTLQGEGLTIGLPTYFLRLHRCNYKCEFCLAPETPVLMADFTYRPLGDLREGDEVIGYSEIPDSGNRRQMVRTRVLRTSRTEGVDRIRFKTDLGDIVCTPDHKIWHSENREGTQYSRWRPAYKFEPGDGVKCYPVPQPSPLDMEEFARGYLAGAADGDGCYWDFAPKNRPNTYRRFRIAANDQEFIDRFVELAEPFGFEFSLKRHISKGFRPANDTMPSAYLIGGDETVKDFEAFLHKNDDDHDSYIRGYLAGIFDAEGSLSNGCLRFAQLDINRPIKERIFNYLTRLDFEAVYEEKGVRFLGGISERLRFFSLCPTAISRKKNDFFGLSNKEATTCKGTEVADKGPVITLTTECGSYVANGLVVKNCDTPETWKPGTPWIQLEDKDIEKLKTTIAGHNLVITGGEPMLQWKNILKYFSAKTIYQHYRELPTYTIESNMSLFLPEMARGFLENLFFLSFSPKLHDWPTESVHKWLMSLCGHEFNQFRFQLKIVCDSVGQFKDTEELMREHYKKLAQEEVPITWEVFSKNVIIQPEWNSCGIGKPALQDLLAYAIDRGTFRVIPQTHKMFGIA